MRCGQCSGNTLTTLGDEHARPWKCAKRPGACRIPFGGWLFVQAIGLRGTQRKRPTRASGRSRPCRGAERDAALADRAGRALEALIEEASLYRDVRDETVVLPAPALRPLRKILDRMANGAGRRPDAAARRTHDAPSGRASAGVAGRTWASFSTRDGFPAAGRLAPPRPRRGYSRLAPRDRAPPPRRARRADRTRQARKGAKCRSS